MSERLTLAALAGRLLALPDGPRRLVALAGPPGAGKTTTADRLLALLNERRPGSADILAMDGYHYDDRLLVPRGDRPRKGAPHTFDLGGFRATIARLKADDGSDIAVPIFDRDIEIARAGARVIAGTTRLVLVEGNYLLLDAPGWRDLKPLFDATVFLAAPETVLEARLFARWNGYGMAEEEIRAKLEGNDLPNMRLVLGSSQPADFTVETGA